MTEEHRCTTDGKPPINPLDASVPTNEKRADGQFKAHWVLCAEERAKGFVRPVREKYVHVGIPGPQFPTRELTAEEQERFGGNGYISFEPYPEGYKGSSTGRFWTQAELDKIDKGCGVETRMPYACAETYAREPGYYGSTFCCGCHKYLPVGARGEFVWPDTNERVGT